MSLKKQLTLACSLFIVTPVYSADSDGAYAIEGAGIASCTHFLESAKKQDNSYFIFGGWIEGYFSASNQHTSNTFDLSPWQSTPLLLKITESICTQKPDLKFHQVISSIAMDMTNQRLDHGGKFIPISEGSTNYVFQEEVIVRMKQVLKDKGLYDGNIDGEYDDPTKKAIKQFQKVAGQPETGLPEQGTLYELFKPKQ